MNKRSPLKAAILLPALLASAMLFTTAAVAAASTTAAKAIPAPIEGTDYTLIENPDPISGPKVHVVEVFGFGCIHCAKLQPDLVVWEKTLPSYVQFEYLPGPFGGLPDAFSRAFFAAQAMQVETRSHSNIFKAVFDDKRVSTAEDVPALYADYGVDAKVFTATMQSFGVSSKVVAANQQIIRWKIEGTPTIVVDGKYRVMESAAGPSVMFHTVDWLIARQRHEHAKH